MSAEELISLLQKYGIKDLLIPIDAEGSFSALTDVSVAYVPQGFKDKGYTDELWFEESIEDDVDDIDVSKLRKVLVLWAT